MLQNEMQTIRSINHFGFHHVWLSALRNKGGNESNEAISNKKGFADGSY
ncbi:MAG: hypothetical protein PWQ06_2502 [Anaerophaga sp.]|nr:hypothetical protein [Anaerophaga sp.]